MRNLWRAAPNIKSLGARLTLMNSCLDRIEAVFAEKELPDSGSGSIPQHSNAPEVEFKNVSFAYGDKVVLRNISFSLEKNRMLALVEPSGGAKSTIANLLIRFWDVKAGQVLVRGKDVREVKLSDLMNHISMVFQRMYLFQDTIYNSISMGRPDAIEAEVVEASKKARCTTSSWLCRADFRPWWERAEKQLCSGEKQRISIALCILKDAPSDIQIPFFMTCFNMDPKPKDFVHPNGITRINHAILGTREELLPLVRDLCDDKMLAVQAGNGVEHIKFAYAPGREVATIVL